MNAKSCQTKNQFDYYVAPRIIRYLHTPNKIEQYVKPNSLNFCGNSSAVTGKVSDETAQDEMNRMYDTLAIKQTKQLNKIRIAN